MKTLGPYVLVRRLGAGGMGEVWTGRRLALGGAAKLVAVKTLLPGKADDRNARKMFLDEARLSMLLTNSNIVQVFDVGEDADGTCYMAMELVDGIDLARLTEKLREAGERLSHSAIAYIIGEILRALVYAHEFDHDGIRRTVVHRDISPQNVMVSVSGEVKLMDFGVARLASEETSGIFIKGKLRYMPPEQYAGSSREPTVDLFAVGAILHELLDGRRFREAAREEAQLVGMCVRGEVPPLICPPCGIPVEFERLRVGLLAPRAANRISSARAAHRLLSQWPGDRDAKFELEEIVRRLVSPERPSPDLRAKSQNPTEIVTEILPVERSSTVSQGSVALVARPSAPVRPGNFAWRGVALAFVGLGVLGVASTGFLLERWSAAEPELPVEAQPGEATVAATKSEPIEPAPAFVQPEPEVQPVTAPLLEPDGASVEAAPLEPVKASKASKASKPKASPRTSVAISAPGVWAQVKIGGKEHTFDRLKGLKTLSTKLSPGEHSVSFRNDPEALWQEVGRVTIPESGSVELEIKDGMAKIVK